MSTAEFVALIVAVLGGGTVGAVTTKYLNRNVDAATAAKTGREAVSSEVQTIRDVLAEVRANDEAKSKEIAELRADRARQAQELTELRERIEKLEERERHMLTRAAVHEAWDALSFQALIAQNPKHPPPPPLGLPAGQ